MDRNKKILHLQWSEHPLSIEKGQPVFMSTPFAPVFYKKINLPALSSSAIEKVTRYQMEQLLLLGNEKKFRFAKQLVRDKKREALELFAIQESKILLQRQKMEGLKVEVDHFVPPHVAIAAFLKEFVKETSFLSLYLEEKEGAVFWMEEGSIKSMASFPYNEEFEKTIFWILEGFAKEGPLPLYWAGLGLAADFTENFFQKHSPTSSLIPLEKELAKAALPIGLAYHALDAKDEMVHFSAWEISPRLEHFFTKKIKTLLVGAGALLSIATICFTLKLFFVQRDLQTRIETLFEERLPLEKGFSEKMKQPFGKFFIDFSKAESNLEEVESSLNRIFYERKEVSIQNIYENLFDLIKKDKNIIISDLKMDLYKNKESKIEVELLALEGAAKLHERICQSPFFSKHCQPVYSKEGEGGKISFVYQNSCAKHKKKATG